MLVKDEHLVKRPATLEVGHDVWCFSTGHHRKL